MRPSNRLVVLIALGLSSCKESSAGSTAPDANAPATSSAAAESVPPSVAELAPIEGALPLGAKMWRRFGDGEWRATTFFVPGPGGEITVHVDMEGAGEALVKPFLLLVRLEGAELAEGSLEIPGRVPPGQKRRETLRLRAPGPGIVKIWFSTLKEGKEAGGTSGCLKVTPTGVQRCTESEEAGGAGI